MAETVFLPPQSITTVSTEEVDLTYPEKKREFRILISAGVTNGFSGTMEKKYCISFNVTEEGFKVKEKIDQILERLIEMIRHPITCDTIVKLVLIPHTYGRYEIEFI